MKTKLFPILLFIICTVLITLLYQDVLASNDIRLSAQPPPSTMTLWVQDNDYKIDGILVIQNPVYSSAPTSGSSAGIFIFSVPFQHSEDWKINTSNNVFLAKLDSGPVYTLFAVLAPINQPTINININNIGSYTARNDAEAIVELNPSYIDTPQDALNIIKSSINISAYDITIVFSHDYGPSDVDYDKNYFSPINQRTYQSLISNQPTNGRLWFIFPNSVEVWNDIFQIILGLLVGLFLAFIEGGTNKRRSVYFYISILILCIFIVVAFFAFPLPLTIKIKSLLVYAISAPILLYNLIMSVHLLRRKFFLTEIYGDIFVDNQPGQDVIILLAEIDGAQSIFKKKIVDDQLNGRYQFFVKPENRPKKYKVIGETEYAKSVESAEIIVEKKGRFPVFPIYLTRKIG